MEQNKKADKLLEVRDLQVSFFTPAGEVKAVNGISYDLNYNLGLVYTMLNDFENAKICYEKAAEINSLLYNAKYALAEIALIYKEIEEAREYFLQATESVITVQNEGL